MSRVIKVKTDVLIDNIKIKEKYFFNLHLFAISSIALVSIFTCFIVQLSPMISLWAKAQFQEARIPQAEAWGY